MRSLAFYTNLLLSKRHPRIPQKNAASFLLNLLHHFNQSPTLGLAKRASFHDLYNITDAALIFVVMSMELGSLLYELTIDRVLYFSFYRNSNGLSHLIAGNNTYPCFS